MSASPPAFVLVPLPEGRRRSRRVSAEIFALQEQPYKDVEKPLKSNSSTRTQKRQVIQHELFNFYRL